MENFEIGNALNLVIEKLEGWITSFLKMLPNLVVAIIIVIIFALLARLIKNIARRSLGKFIKNPTITNIVLSILSITVSFAGVIIALSILDLDKTVSSLLAGIGIAGLALGFAFKEGASNVISGIYMAVKGPINEEDIIEYEDTYGIVKKISLRATTVRTLQGQDVIIPNRLLMENSFTHYSINKERRIDLNIGISYGDDLEKAEKVTIDTVKSIEYLKPGRPVDLYYMEFGDSSINFIVRYWVEFNKQTDYLRALSDGIKRIKKAYDKHNITITFPIRTLDFGIKGGKTLADMLDTSGFSKKTD